MPVRQAASAPSQPLSPVVRVAGRALIAHAVTTPRDQFGSVWVTNGSQLSVWQSSIPGPTSSLAPACQRDSGASTIPKVVLERASWGAGAELNNESIDILQIVSIILE